LLQFTYHIIKHKKENIMSEQASHQQEKPKAGEYQDFPIDQPLFHHSVQRSNGEVDGGWLAIGAGVNERGHEFTRLVKTTDEGILQKDVNTGRLQELNSKLYEERQAAQRLLGGGSLQASHRAEQESEKPGAMQLAIPKEEPGSYVETPIEHARMSFVLPDENGTSESRWLEEGRGVAEDGVGYFKVSRRDPEGNVQHRDVTFVEIAALQTQRRQIAGQ
jgi:hypothetical protein